MEIHKIISFVIGSTIFFGLILSLLIIHIWLHDDDILQKYSLKGLLKIKYKIIHRSSDNVYFVAIKQLNRYLAIPNRLASNQIMFNEQSLEYWENHEHKIKNIKKLLLKGSALKDDNLKSCDRYAFNTRYEAEVFKDGFIEMLKRLQKEKMEHTKSKDEKKLKIKSEIKSLNKIKEIS